MSKKLQLIRNITSLRYSLKNDVMSSSLLIEMFDKDAVEEMSYDDLLNIRSALSEASRLLSEAEEHYYEACHYITRHMKRTRKKTIESC